ncbi:AP-4 complex accessory subunit tepsin-like isoform X1 [Asterias rubens]|uniref:AP-4 complex accessory subunit tepsin-like isoform X1 n=2 Tax=Asterias rubens TaxID=7604 RepID=UPI001455CCE6|nr:AP-4 complex accessory subunit tepsin-like isoform X1 [Asterias rubens]
MEKVTFVQKLPMILKSTSDDDTPTPGYLYQELSDLTYVSSGYCNSLLDVLVDRLDKSSHHVKFKVLRVMKHVVENGSEEFRAGLLRRSAGIQHATKFSGPPDPLHGNAPYIAVRSAAKQLSEVLFDTEQCRSQEASSPRKMAPSSGIGSSRSGITMQGFGNTVAPVHKQKSFTETVKGGFQQLAESFRESTTPPAFLRVESDYKPLGGSDSDSSTSAVFSLSSGRRQPQTASESCDRQGEYKPVVVDDGEASSVKRHQPGSKDLARVTAGRHKQGRPAGGWEDCSRGRGSNASNSDGQHSGDSTELSERLESVSVEDLSMETKLVEEFVSTSNGKLPSRDALSQFVKHCCTLNCEKITELLHVELQSTSDSIHMRCLCALEALMRDDIVSSDYLYGILPHTLTTLQEQSTDKLIQSKASKILRQLERTCEEATVAKSSTRHHNYLSSPLTNNSSIDLQQSETCGDDYQSVNLDSLVPFSRQDETNGEDHTVSVSNSPSQKSKSLFSGMDIGAKSLQRTSEPTLMPSDVAGQISHASNVDTNVRLNAGPPQLLDDLLDLSITNEPTLTLNTEECQRLGTHLPPSGNDLLDLSITNEPTLTPNTEECQRLGTHLQPSEKTHQSLQLTATAQDCLLSGLQVESCATEVSNNSNTIITGTRQAHSESNKKVVNTKSQTVSRRPDSIMSRQANLDDLLAATGITVASGNIGKPHHVSKKEPSPIQGTSTNPVVSGKPTVNAEQISRLYPQLAGVTLSGSSAVPLKLGERPLEGNFSFMITKDEGGKEKSQRKGSFDFVKDAMITSKK